MTNNSYHYLGFVEKCAEFGINEASAFQLYKKAAPWGALLKFLGRTSKFLTRGRAGSGLVRAGLRSDIKSVGKQIAKAQAKGSGNLAQLINNQKANVGNLVTEMGNKGAHIPGQIKAMMTGAKTDATREALKLQKTLGRSGLSGADQYASLKGGLKNMTRATPKTIQAELAHNQALVDAGKAARGARGAQGATGALQQAGGAPVGGAPAPAPVGGAPAPAPVGGAPAPAPVGGAPAPAPTGGAMAGGVPTGAAGAEQGSMMQSIRNRIRQAPLTSLALGVGGGYMIGSRGNQQQAQQEQPQAQPMFVMPQGRGYYM